MRLPHPAGRLMFAMLMALLAAPAAAQEAALPPPVDRSASAGARQEVREARAALARGERILASNWRAVQQEYERSQEYQEALNRLRVAQDEYNRMRRFVREHLEQDGAYVEAQQARDELQDKIRGLWKTEKWTMSRVQPLAERALNHNVKLMRMEIIAIATEPALEASRNEMFAAAGEVRMLREAFRDAVPRDPMVRAAQEEVAFQEQRLQAAQEQLDEAERREAIQAAARAARLREMQANGQLPGN